MGKLNLSHHHCANVPHFAADHVQDLFTNRIVVPALQSAAATSRKNIVSTLAAKSYVFINCISYHRMYAETKLNLVRNRQMLKRENPAHARVGSHHNSNMSRPMCALHHGTFSPNATSRTTPYSATPRKLLERKQYQKTLVGHISTFAKHLPVIVCL